MPVPSRAYVGVFVFGLIATLLVVPYTILVLVGYHPTPTAPYQAIFPTTERTTFGFGLFLVLASFFCVLLAVAGWRNLVRGARRDAQARRNPPPTRAPAGKAEPPAEPKPAPVRRDEPPPGYN